jgi:hypothetical protein
MSWELEIKIPHKYLIYIYSSEPKKEANPHFWEETDLIFGLIRYHIICYRPVTYSQGRLSPKYETIHSNCVHVRSPMKLGRLYSEIYQSNPVTGMIVYGSCLWRHKYRLIPRLRSFSVSLNRICKIPTAVGGQEWNRDENIYISSVAGILNQINWRHKIKHFYCQSLLHVLDHGVQTSNLTLMKMF